MHPTPTRRPKLRYRWSHRHPLHRAIVRTANRVLPLVPFQAKYAVSDALRSRRLPYRLLTSASVAIQVGAPSDTLRAGRSRAMAFARRTRPAGRVLVVEPDGASADEFRRACAQHGLHHVDVVCAAAWSERTALELVVDPRHPATSFTSGSTAYTADELTRFRQVMVDAAPLDDLVDDAAIGHVDLISITTNGSEPEILRGLGRTLERDHPYLCLARTADSYAKLMAGIGYRLMGEDDRGFTFRYGG